MTKLQGNETSFRILFEQAAVGVGLLDTNTGRFLHVNRKYTEITGYPEQEMLSLDFMRITYPEDLAEDLALMEQLKRGEIREFSLEKRLIRRDETPVWVALTVSPMWSAGEEPSQHVAVVIDITAHKEAEQKRQREQEAFESTMAAVPDLLFDIDDEGCIYDFRAPQPELLAAPPGEFLGRKMSEFLDVEATDEIRRGIQKALLHGRSSGHRYRVQLPSGEHWFEMSLARKVVDSGRPRMIAITRDITTSIRAEERRQQLEAQLRQAQKMEALGTLAGGIAHDFNNLLVVIGLNTDLTRRLLPAGHPATLALQTTEVAVRRAEKLIQQILAFSRQQPVRRTTISPNLAVIEATNLLRSILPAGIELLVKVSDDVPAVLADSTQLHQVLINLGTNAWQAIAQGKGVISFEVLRASISSGHAFLAPGEYALLRVRDDGCGMSEEIRERIFEPFFTTKGPGKGSGLGLSVVHGIIQEHGGVIRVDSAPGQGACFEIYLHAEQTQVAPSLSSRTAPLGGSARVFYVDDEEMLLRPMLSLLESLDYRPTGFSSPRRALEQIRTNPDGLDLLLTDMNMPELSGLELAREVIAIRPDLPVVLVTGYASQTEEQLLEAGVRARLTKPFAIEELGEVLKAQLPAARR